jgi:hypothetical protein
VSKRNLIVVVAAAGGVLILLLYGLIVRSILNERRDRVLLEDDIFMMEGVLSGQQGDQVLSTREAELAVLQATLEAAEFAFPSEMDSTEVLDYIFTAAADNGVNLSYVQAHEPVTGTLGSSIYRVFAYDVEVEGELGTIPAFLAALESGDIETLTLSQLCWEAQPESALYRATLVVQVYFRR